jgi:competence ComEA-like helix-hairpin-helix protein
MSSSERRALLLLLSLGLVGQGVRWLATRPEQAAGEVQLVQTLPAQSPIAHRDSILALARPLGPDERVDADRATAQELARLPRIGLALAKTIVADREAHGPFAELGGLDRVPGVGAGLLSVIGPHLTFSGTVRASPSLIAPPSPALSAPALLDLNTATEAELVRLPGIGPSRARDIVAYRTRHGSFSRVADLDRIPGIGPAAMAKLSALVRVQ